MTTGGPSPVSRRREPQVPNSVGTVGMWLFLAALFMLFAASMLGYVFVRTNGEKSPAMGVLHIPAILFLSTVLILVASFSMHRSLTFLRLEKQEPFRKWILASLGLTLAFIAVQTPAMIGLLRQHQALRAQGLHLYGLIFTLILLHAAHVVGGLVRLIPVTIRAQRNAYDHEHYLPVKHLVMYWHFLDGVWIVMFAMFLILR